MNQRPPKRKQTAERLRGVLRAETPALAGWATLAIVHLFHERLFADLHNYPLTVLLFLWLFGTMMWCAFLVVRHADAIAEQLGEPYGTLVLTFAVTIIEVAILASVILHGENNPTLARDAMFATLMIALNFVVGMALVVGALRYFEQEYSLAGARAYLSVIASLAVFTLILPKFMQTEPDPSHAPYKTFLFAAIPILFYAVFIVIQTARHRALFDEPEGNGTAGAPAQPCIMQRSAARSPITSRCWS